MITLILFGGMLLLFALGVPVAMGLGLAGLAAIQDLVHVNPGVIISRMFYGLDNFVILAVPLFMLLGEVMMAARITDRLVEFAQAFVGRLPGGLGQVARMARRVENGGPSRPTRSRCAMKPMITISANPISRPGTTPARNIRAIDTPATEA